MTGQLFGDRYQVGDTLGFGGMSEVYRGRDLRLGRDVAIKVLRADLARDPSFQTRFRREAQNAASLNHPAIVAVYDTGEAENSDGVVPYIVMEYVDGETLRDLLKREGPLPPKRALEIVADVCAALDFSHRHGIVHRDIKPANVMLTRAGAVKVMDFGIARAVSDAQASVTATAAVIGTAQYLSPEQARGEAVDARSDVYSTGCVLFELLTGQPPFTGDSPVAVAYQHVREDPKAPSAVKPGIPRELDAVVLKALNKNPLNRYQTAAEMRADLVRALAGQAVQAPKVMDDAERTALLGGRGAAPAASATPSIMAAPQRIIPQQNWVEEREPSRSSKVWGYVGVAALFAALLAGAIFLTIKFTSAPPPPADVAVPPIKGLTEEQAKKALTDSGFKLGDPEMVESPDPDKGKVIYQKPSAGTPASPGSTVSVQIGLGLGEIEVPNLKGFNEATAKSELERRRLLIKPEPATSSEQERGLVIDQQPKPGTKLKPNGEVIVKIGRGPNEVTIPNDLVGKQLPEVTKILQDLKLTVAPSTAVSFEPKDKVLKIDPPSGQRLIEGSPVRVTVSDGSQFKMPDIAAGRPTLEDAQQQLKDAGYEGTVVREDQVVPYEDRSGWDRVVAQNPEPGSAVDRRAKIVLKVGVAPRIQIPLDIQGLTLQQAQDKLRGVGWQGQFNTEWLNNNDRNNDGKIAWTNPIGGTEIQITDNIYVGVYKRAPVPTPTPTPTPSPSPTPETGTIGPPAPPSSPPPAPPGPTASPTG